MSAESIKSRLASMEERASSLSVTVGSPVHAEILRQMKRANIVVSSGDLSRSLQDPNDPLHVWEQTDSGYVFGSLARAARYNPKAVPSLAMTSIARVVADTYRGE